MSTQTIQSYSADAFLTTSNSSSSRRSPLQPLSISHRQLSGPAALAASSKNLPVWDTECETRTTSFENTGAKPTPSAYSLEYQNYLRRSRTSSNHSGTISPSLRSTASPSAGGQGHAKLKRKASIVSSSQETDLPPSPGTIRSSLRHAVRSVSRVSQGPTSQQRPVLATLNKFDSASHGLSWEASFSDTFTNSHEQSRHQTLSPFSNSSVGTPMPRSESAGGFSHVTASTPFTSYSPELTSSSRNAYESQLKSSDFISVQRDRDAKHTNKKEELIDSIMGFEVATPRRTQSVPPELAHLMHDRTRPGTPASPLIRQSSDSARRPDSTSQYVLFPRQNGHTYSAVINSTSTPRSVVPLSPASSTTSIPHFGLRSRNAWETTVSAASDAGKPLRRGPAAGTGYEGYGQAVRRSRRHVSSTSPLPSSRPTSSSINTYSQGVDSQTNIAQESNACNVQPSVSPLLRTESLPANVSVNRASWGIYVDPFTHGDTLAPVMPLPTGHFHAGQTSESTGLDVADLMERNVSPGGKRLSSVINFPGDMRRSLTNKLSQTSLKKSTSKSLQTSRMNFLRRSNSTASVELPGVITRNSPRHSVSVALNANVRHSKVASVLGIPTIRLLGADGTPEILDGPIPIFTQPLKTDNKRSGVAKKRPSTSFWRTSSKGSSCCLPSMCLPLPPLRSQVPVVRPMSQQNVPQVIRVPESVTKPQRPASRQSFQRPFVLEEQQPHLQTTLKRDSQVVPAPFELVPPSEIERSRSGRPGRNGRPSKALSAISEVSNSTTKPLNANDAMPNARASSLLGDFLSLPPLRDSDGSCSSDSGSFVFPDVPSLQDTYIAGAPVAAIPASSLVYHPAFQQSGSDNVNPETRDLIEQMKRLSSDEAKLVGSDAQRIAPKDLTAVKRNTSKSILPAAGSDPISDTNISFSLSDLVDFYDEDTDSDSGQLRFSANAQYLAEAFVRSISSLAEVGPISVNQRDLQQPGQESRPTVNSAVEHEQNTSSSLRFGALMTSKWLSFGRVLFSPAHTEVSEKVDSRVLVIDGLGKGMSTLITASPILTSH